MRRRRPFKISISAVSQETDCVRLTVVSRASRSTSGLGGKERLVTFARYSWALPECWQSQSDCTAANYDVTSHNRARSITIFSRVSPSCSDGDEESVVQGRKPDGLFRAATQAGGGDPGLRPRERRFRKPPHRKKSLCYSLLPARHRLQGVSIVIVVSPDRASKHISTQTSRRNT